MRDVFTLRTKEEFPNLLLEWYEEHKRDLPWRRTFLPYHIWISEMMLQQTQMTRGILYFERWIKRFPTIEDVANADIEELYKYWEGLGYYSRVRNIHITAKRLVEEYQGIIPQDVSILESLNGIGAYTARAIASIAYNVDTPVVDANVTRILTRIFGIQRDISLQSTKKELYDLAVSILPNGKARAFNQAMMELGALLCSTHAKCFQCPFSTLCYAYTYNLSDSLPVQKPKKEIKHYTTMMLLLIKDDTIFMRKRTKQGPWANLWEFPEYIFTPKPIESIEQASLFAQQKQKKTLYHHIPKAHDLAKAFYNEYAISIAVQEVYMQTKYTFSSNKVTLYAFLASLIEDKKIFTSSQYPRQKNGFYTKDIIDTHTLASGQNTIRSTLTNII